MIIYYFYAYMFNVRAITFQDHELTKKDGMKLLARADSGESDRRISVLVRALQTVAECHEQVAQTFVLVTVQIPLWSDCVQHL